MNIQLLYAYSFNFVFFLFSGYLLCAALTPATYGASTTLEARGSVVKSESCLYFWYTSQGKTVNDIKELTIEASSTGSSKVNNIYASNACMACVAYAADDYRLKVGLEH